MRGSNVARFDSERRLPRRQPSALFFSSPEVCNGPEAIGIPGAAWRPRHLRRGDRPEAHWFRCRGRRADDGDGPVPFPTPIAGCSAGRPDDRSVSPDRRPRYGEYRRAGRSARKYPWCPRPSKPRESRGADRPIRMVPGRREFLSERALARRPVFGRRPDTRTTAAPGALPVVYDPDLTPRRPVKPAGRREVKHGSETAGGAPGFGAGKERRGSLISGVRFSVFGDGATGQ